MLLPQRLMNFDRLRIIDVSRLCQLAFHTAENLFSPQKTGVLQASNMRVPGFRGSSNPSNPGFSAKGVAKLRRQLRRVNRLKYSIWSTGSSCLVNGVAWHPGCRMPRILRAGDDRHGQALLLEILNNCLRLFIHLGYAQRPDVTS